ncbi:ADP-ribose pyrophosphatase YjhB, NUDIX family [Streptomyces sp. di188]|nr:ADP-ribose pyrophosphatase YjhB, NUDIX family [Streptomyces sp. di188]
MRGPAEPVPPRDEDPRFASALIRGGGGEYPLHLRDDVPGIREPGCWSLPGGAREPGDRSLEDTVRREPREEAGLDLPVLEPFAVTGALDDGSGHASVRVYAGRWEGDPARLPLTEGLMLRWFRPDGLDRLRTHPDARGLVRRHATGRASVPRAAGGAAGRRLSRCGGPGGVRAARRRQDAAAPTRAALGVPPALEAPGEARLPAVGRPSKGAGNCATSPRQPAPGARQGEARRCPEPRRKTTARPRSHATSHSRPFNAKSYARVSVPWRTVRKPKDRRPPAATFAL